MKKLCCLAVVVFVLSAMALPEQASAQLFRRWQNDSQQDNRSHLPGADPTAKRAADYGAEQVSEDIRNEVNGRAPVRPAPDFMSDAPLAAAAKRFQLPEAYTVQRPIAVDNGARVQPPMTKHVSRDAFGSHWMTDNRPESDIGNLPPQTMRK